MEDEVLTPGWRAAFGVAGALMLVIGGAGVPAEVWRALHGAPLAWLAVPLVGVVAATGALLARAAVRGRVKRRNLTFGQRPNA